MIKIIKINNKTNYMIDSITNKILDKYDSSNNNLVLVTKLEDNSVLKVKSSEIKQQYGGSIYFDYENDRYIIEDQYQDMMIKSGYIVLNNYDKEQETDRNKGIEIRKTLIEKIRNVSYLFCNEYDSFDVLVPNNNETKIKFVHGNYKFTIVFNTINNIVTKNQQRKINGLSFYPFKKGMDKYGTIYVSVFCQRVKSELDIDNKYDISEQFLTNFLKSLSNEYSSDKFHYEPTVIRGRILNWE